MNRSFSKIRHIQEANKSLEQKYILKETMEFDVQGQQVDNMMTQAQTELNNLGMSNIKLSDYIDEKNPVCIIQTGNQEQDSFITKVSDWAMTQTPEVIKKAITDLIGYIKKQQQTKPVSEQVAALAMAPIVIGTITIPGGVLVAIAGILVITLVVDLVRAMSGGRQRQPSRRRTSCAKYHSRGGTNNPEKILRMSF